MTELVSDGDKIVGERGTFGDDDALDRVTWIKYPGGNGGQIGEQVSYTYNDQGLPKSVAGTNTYVGDTTYDAPGRVELRKLGADVLRTDCVYYPWTTANGLGRLQQLKTGTPSSPTSLQDLRYTYDAVGNVKTIQDYKVTGGTQTQSFGYDALDRLLSANVSGGSSGQGQYSESYTYNAIGNLNATTWTYGTQSSNCPDGALSKPHAVVTAGSSAYCYDRNGNMVRRTSVILTI